MGCKELRATTRGKKEGEKKEEGKIYVLELHRVVCVFAFFLIKCITSCLFLTSASPLQFIDINVKVSIVSQTN